MSLRVLLVTSEKGLRGGERQVQLLGQGLSAKGHVAALCAPPDAQLARGWEGPVYPVAMANEIDPRGMLGLRRAAGGFKPQAIHAFTARAHGLIDLSGLSPPLVVTRAVAFAAGSNPLGRRKYGRASTHFIAVSTAVRQALLHAGAQPAQVAVIPPGVPPRHPDPVGGAQLRRDLCPAAPWIVGAVGALEPAKGFDLLLRALAQLGAPNDAHLLLLGEGPQRPSLERLAHQLGVAPRLHWLEPTVSLEALLAAADVWASPSVSEGFGMAVVEAMGAGVPVVATDSGGVRDILGSGGERGSLLADRDPRSLAEQLVTTRRASAAGALRDRIAAAREAALGFSADRMVSATVELYERIIAPDQRGAG